jgi:hypothetical protein
MTPADPQPPAAAPAPPESAPAPGAPHRESRRLWAVLFATLCLDVGFFLLVFPWTPDAANFALYRPEWRAYWDNTFVRGAISGLGVVNLYFAFVEIAALCRSAKR